VSLNLKHEANLFGFVLGKLKELELSLSRKWDFSLYDYKFVQ